MTRFLRRLLISQKGQALPAVLAMLALGGLMVVPSLDYAATSLNHGRAIDRGVRGLYAADAGIEDVLWSLKQCGEPHTSLAQAVNGMQVTMSTVNKGYYTLVAGDWVSFSPSGHFADLSISSSIVWDDGHNGYLYTITVTWSGSGNCWVLGVGARLPVGYNYQAESVHFYTGSLSYAEPADGLDGEGAHMRDWSFPKIKLNSGDTVTQKLLITGSGDLGDDYGWTEAQREDVGTVGELTGNFYVITATATKSGVVARKVETNVMVSGSIPSITSYRILQ